jgi:hypothetical protein
VRQAGYAIRFRYTYFPDTELARFRIYVCFNTAKYAYRRGEFRLDVDGERPKVADNAIGAGPDRKNCIAATTERERIGDWEDVIGEDKDERFKVSTALYSTRPSTKFVSGSFEDFKKRAEVIGIGGGKWTPPSSTSRGDDAATNDAGRAPVCKCKGNDYDEEKKVGVMTEEGLEGKTEEKTDQKVDPFKVRSVSTYMRNRLTLFCRLLLLISAGSSS